MFVCIHKTRCNIFLHTMSVYRVFVWLIVFHLQELSTYDDCMIWNILGDNLIFTCTIKDFSEPVTLINNLGKASTTCSFEHVTNQSIKCTLQNDSITFSVDVKNKAVIFKVNKIKSNYVDGIWSCSQGNRKSTCNVSKLKGIVEDTNIYLQGELCRINNALKVSLRCFACRVSRGNNVEFLINGRSELSITYDPITGKCTDQIGQCNPDKCSCVSTRNEFNATFPFSENSHINYSCGMQFIDKESSMIFSKIANLHFNGTGFQVMTTDTNILKQKAPSKDTDLETENVTATLPTIIEVSHEINAESMPAWISIAAFLTITVFVLIIAVYICHRQQHRKESQNKTFVEDERDLLRPDLGPVLSTEVGISTDNEPRVSTYTSMKNDAGNYFGPVLSTEVGTSTDNEPRVSTYTSMINGAGNYFGPVLSTEVGTSTDKEIENKETGDIYLPDILAKEDKEDEEKHFPEINKIENKETDDICLPEIPGDESFLQAQKPLQFNGPYVARKIAPKQLDLQQKLPKIKILNILKTGEKLMLTGKFEDEYKLIVMNIHVNTPFILPLHSSKIPWKLTEIDQRGIDMIALSYVESDVIDIINVSKEKLETMIEIPDKCRALSPYGSFLCVIVYQHILLVDLKGEIIKDTRLPTDDVDYMFVHKEQIIYTYIETLYCCDFEGELIWKFKPDGIRFVSDLAVDGYGNSYVSGSSPYSVLVISADGTQQKTLLSEDTLVSIRFDSKTNCLLVFPSKDASIVRLYDVHVRSFQ